MHVFWLVHLGDTWWGGNNLSIRDRVHSRGCVVAVGGVAHCCSTFEEDCHDSNRGVSGRHMVGSWRHMVWGQQFWHLRQGSFTWQCCCCGWVAHCCSMFEEDCHDSNRGVSYPGGTWWGVGDTWYGGDGGELATHGMAGSNLAM